MHIYFSYSTIVNTSVENLNLTLKFASKSVYLAKKYYDNVFLITDTKGKEIFKNIEFTEIYNILDIVPIEYKDVWSLGKLYSIKYISEKQEHFAHLDFDFFITQKLPNKIENSEMFVQSIEYNLPILNYRIPFFKKKCPKKYSIVENDIAYNCGIIGGKNYSFLYEYADKAIRMVQDKENENFWKDSETKIKYWTKAVLAEQYFLSCLLKEKNIIPDLLFDNRNNKTNYYPSTLSYFLDTGAIHLYGTFKSNEYLYNILDLDKASDISNSC